MLCHQRLNFFPIRAEILVANVASGHDQKFGGSAAQKMTEDEISILTEDYSSIAVGNGANPVVGAAIEAAGHPA